MSISKAKLSTDTDQVDAQDIRLDVQPDRMPQGSQVSHGGNADDIYFEPTAIQDNNYNPPSVEIKQDITSDDGLTQLSTEEQQRKSWIGAYRDSKGGLPAEKGFPIQVGSELFRLSGASIMSDAPSYFSRFFEDQIRKSGDWDTSVKTLYIDRDPETFKDIARHLQGYHIHPTDGRHFVRVFSDAQFYSLPRLNKQLFDSDIYMSIGEQDFKFSRDLFSSPGDSPNYFSFGFGVFPHHQGELYPGLDREGLIRPPPAEAPEAPSRSASTFADILTLLRGYPLKIRDAEHRAELLRDCRYYHFKGLEQKVIYHHISLNAERQSQEIVLRIEDLRQPGITLQFDTDNKSSISNLPSGWLRYARPYVDDHPYDLIVETPDESSKLDLQTMHIEFFEQLLARMTSLLGVIAAKLRPVTPAVTVRPSKANSMKVTFSSATHILLDGEDFQFPSKSAPERETTGSLIDSTSQTLPFSPPSSATTKKRKLSTWSSTSHEYWIIKRAQWRIEIHTSRATQKTDPTAVAMGLATHSGPADPSFSSPTTRLYTGMDETQEQTLQNGSGADTAVAEIVLHAVKLDAVRGEWGRNRARRFLVE